MIAQSDFEFRNRQAMYYLDFCEKHGGTTEKWENYAQLDPERQNLLDTMEWAFLQQQWQRVIDFQYLLWSYWELRSYWSEQLDWCNRALYACDQLEKNEQLSPNNTQKKGVFHLAICWVLINQEKLDDATKHAEMAIEDLKQINDQNGLAVAYRHLGVINFHLGNWSLAKNG